MSLKGAALSHLTELGRVEGRDGVLRPGVREPGEISISPELGFLSFSELFLRDTEVFLIQH